MKPSIQTLSGCAASLRRTADLSFLPNDAKTCLRENAHRLTMAGLSEATGLNTMQPSRSFPLIVDIARAARSSSSAKMDLTSEEREKQHALREQFREIGDFGGAAGVFLPWRHESRALTATGADGGDFTIGVDVPSIGLALRDKLVLAQLGANTLFNLVGNLQLPREKAGINAEWTAENAAPSAAGAPLFGMLSLSPHRISAFFDVTEQMLLQGENIEPFIRSALMAALAEAIQGAVINGTGANSQPLGILRTPGIGALAYSEGSGSAPVYRDLVQLEYLVTNAKADLGNLGWVTSPKVRKALRGRMLAAGGPADTNVAVTPVWPTSESNMLLGYPAGVTNSCPDTLTAGVNAGILSALIFGEWSELFLGFWGPGVLIDAVPVSTGSDGMKGIVRVIARAYFDGGVRSVAAFSAKQDCICA